MAKLLPMLLLISPDQPHSLATLKWWNFIVCAAFTTAAVSLSSLKASKSCGLLMIDKALFAFYRGCNFSSSNLGSRKDHLPTARGSSSGQIPLNPSMILW